MVSDKKNTPRKAAPNPKANSCILGITYLMVALFLGLAVYMGYFLQVRSEDVINNSYNARLDRFSDRIVRGKIMAGDGTVLAETQVDADGNETRVYYYGSVFDHAVGYSAKGKTGIEARGIMSIPPWTRNFSRQHMPPWATGKAWSLPWSLIRERCWPWYPSPDMTPIPCSRTGIG